MIDPEVFENEVAALETLLGEKLSARGKTLSARLDHAGRRLPRRLHKLGKVITTAQSWAGHPRMWRMVEPDKLDAAFAEITTYLKTVDPAERRRAALLGMFGALVFNLLLVFALSIVMLKWQGLL